MATISRTYIENLKKEYKGLVNDSRNRTVRKINELYPDKLDTERTQRIVDSVIPELKDALGDIPNSVAFKGSSYDKCKKMEAIDIRVYLDVDCDVVTYDEIKSRLIAKVNALCREKENDLTRWQLKVWEDLLEKKGVPVFDYEIAMDVPVPTDDNLQAIRDSLVGDSE